MVEMLGVLAVVGLLSIIGLAGIRSALDSHKANTIVQAVNRRATVLSADKNFGTGFTPDSAFGRDTDYTISCASLNDNFFACTVADVPQAVCQKVLNLDWKMPASITPTTCAETNEMAFTFSKDLDGAMTQCADDTECTTPQATCVNGFCVEPETKTCDTEHPENPCGDACKVCNDKTLKCENACTRKAYLESSGSALIDTGLNYFADVEFTAKMRRTAAMKALGVTGTRCIERENATTNVWRFRNADQVLFTTNLLVTDKHTLKWKNNEVFGDGAKLGDFTKTIASGSRMYLFGISSSSRYPLIMYSCKLWNPSNGALVRDFVPVLSPQNDACMYDKISKELFCNQGSGSFTTD